MSAQAPDHRSLSSWEDAFTSAPVPAVRALERSIRSDISTNHSRLRSLVGSSYRDLLSTAATIADMDTRMRGLESLLSDDISRKCNSRLLDQTKARSKQLQDASRAAETAELQLAARVSVLRACPSVIVRILREQRAGGGTGGLLAAAKVLVLGRVLYTQKLKGLGSTGQGRFTGVVEAAFRRLRGVREKLRLAIESRMTSAGVSVDGLLDSMAAYSLAMQASAAEVLRYFHQIRAATISRLLGAKDSDSGPVKALEIWLQTLRDTQAVFPRQLAGVLSQLKARPLLAGEDMLDITAFDLDIHLNWLGDDIKGFVPTYVRHDDLDIAAAKKQLSTWAPATLKSYLTQLQTSLQAQDDLPTVARLRRECLTAWFSGSARIAGVPRGDVLDGLRSAFSQRLAALTEQRSNSLSDLSTRIQTTLTAWNAQETVPYAPALWDPRTANIDLSNGGKAFTTTLQASLRGRSLASDTILRDYRAWLAGISAIETTIASQRKLRWQDLSDDYDDSSDEEEALEQSLSKDDPAALETRLAASVTAAIDSFHASLRDASRALPDTDPAAPAKAAFLLRLLRDFAALLPQCYKGPAEGASSSDPGLAAELHRRVAAPVLASVAARHSSAVSGSLRASRLAVRALWGDGTGLPVLPSPWAFRVLRTAQDGMAGEGADLWTRGAVVVLRERLGERIAGDLGKARRGDAGDSGSEGEDSEGGKDKYTQQMFDTRYLAAALAGKERQGSAETVLKEHIDWLTERSQLDEEKRQQVTKSADEYWKRTSLLFALLA